MPFSNIALVGASGTLGSQILTALLRHFQPDSIKVLTRRGSTNSSYPNGIKVTEVPSYDDHENLLKALGGSDVLISALRTRPALQFEPALVRAATEAGVRRFMPSEYTMDVLHPSYGSEAKSATAKKRVEWAEELHRISERGEIEYTTLVTGPFVDFCIASGFWEFDFKTRRATLYGDEKAKGTGCSLRFTGECVVKVLQGDEQTRNKRIRVAEMEYSGSEILDELERAAGTEWVVERREAGELRKREMEESKMGDEMGEYITFVVKMNLVGSDAGRFDDGLLWESEGEDALKRKTLHEIVEEIVHESQN